jgi:serine phosphatase RsbU (regulator of sigma subunit)
VDRDLASAYAAALDTVLRHDRLLPPGAIDELTVLGVQQLGATSAVVWLVDYEQVSLGRLGGPTGLPDQRLSVDGSMAGRCFRSVELLETDADGTARALVPLLDGLERLGVLEVVLPEDALPLSADLRSALTRMAHLLAELLVSNGAYTDHYEWVRRKQAMSLPAEMQHRLLPPLTFGTDRVVISGLLAPAYDVGGDAFDYALNGNIAHVAVFDAVGHGLQASLLANLAVSCYRNTRRAGLDLAAAVATIDHALDEMFGGERFVTAMLGQLDVDTGTFRWINAGHPAPMLLRDGHVVKELQGRPVLPLGINRLLTTQEAAVSVEALQPGDRLLLLTDGVDEARNADGEFFGRRRLAEFAAKEASSGLPAPEAMRRLQQAVLKHQVGQLQDDATMVFVEWLTGGGQRLQPEQ